MSKLSERDKQGGCGKRPFAGMSKMRPNAAGLDSAAALKKVPGRKTDVLDSQWIQTLHSYGLLNASFRPEGEIERTFSSIPSISASLAQTIVAEIGTDMSKFPNEKHFCSWLGLAPKN